jgi:pentapeptide MXKDX repeat protein
MSHGLRVGLVALLTLGAAARLAAQQGQMQHDGMQHDSMQHNGLKNDGMGMSKDAMGKDGMAMDHGMMMLPRGTFAGSGGHKAGGSFTVTAEGGKTVFKLGSDFSVEKAPDLYLVLSAGPEVSQGAVFLGKISRFSGAQVFEVPSGTNLEDFSHIVLWNRKDKVALGAASLAGGVGMMHK